MALIDPCSGFTTPFTSTEYDEDNCNEHPNQEREELQHNMLHAHSYTINNNEGVDKQAPLLK